MTFRILIFLALANPTVCLAEIPESIVGKWEMDFVRTMSEFIDQALAANPGVATPEQIKEKKAELATRGPQADGQLTAIITNDTIRMITQQASGSELVTYKVIGGNSQLLILDATSEEVGSAVVNIRLVEGGIAIATLDCQTQPDVCERMRAQQRMGAEDSINTAIDREGNEIRVEGTPQTAITQPQWVYFKPLRSSE